MNTLPKTMIKELEALVDQGKIGLQIASRMASFPPKKQKRMLGEAVAVTEFLKKLGIVKT